MDKNLCIFARACRGRALRDINFLSLLKSARTIRRLNILADHRQPHSDIEKLLKIPYVLIKNH